MEQLTDALQRAQAARQHEKRSGHRLKAEMAERAQDENRAAWYASCLVAEQAGTELPM